jgi:FlaA1/EpsC-like NDP-sugar epimerase
LLREPRGELHALGFLDDDPRKKGRTIHGVPVLGTELDLERIVREHGIREVVMAGPENDVHQLEIRRRCEVLGIAVRRYARPFGDLLGREERAE